MNEHTTAADVARELIDDQHGPAPLAPWEPPATLSTGDLPGFPLDAIPRQLCAFREFCAEVAEAYQVPLELPALLALAAGAAALARKLRVHVRADHYEPVNLFAVVVLPPAERKSVVCRVVAEPITEFELSECKRLATAIEDNARERRMMVKRMEFLENKFAKSSGGEADADLKREIEELAEKLRATPELVAPRFLADDASPEALTRLLHRHQGRMAVLLPEGGELFELMGGRYGKPGTINLGVYLRGHAGDDLRVDRVSRDRPPEFVRDPALTLGLAVQPDVLRGLAAKPGFRGRGLLGRFLFSLPASRLGWRRIDPPGVSAGASDRYRVMIRAALELAAPVEDGRERPFVVRFSPKALEVLSNFQAEVEVQLRDGGGLCTIRDWGGKLVGLVARIAGVYHGLLHAQTGDPSRSPIDEETTVAAILLGRYAIEHAKSAFGEMGADPAVELARKLLRWIETRHLESFSRRDAFMALRPSVEKVTQLEAPLDLLEQHAYIRPTEQVHTGRGRKPSPTYEVNPLAHNPQNAQNCSEDLNCARSAHSALRVTLENGAASAAVHGTALSGDFSEKALNLSRIRASLEAPGTDPGRM